MNNLIPFQFDGINIRVIVIDGEPWFVGKDVCDALGYADATTALRSHCKGVQKLHPLQTAGGLQQTRVISEGDLMRLVVNSTLPAAEAFERKVFDEILPTIRKTGSYGVGLPAPVSPSAIQPTKEYRALFGIAKLIGLDKNAAAIAANQAVATLTGTNVLQLLGTTHLDAANQDTQYFTPTELGKRIGTSARGVNLLLAEAGMQLKRGEVWEVTDAGREFARLYDTGKKHGSGVPVTQIKWSPTVLPMLGSDKEAA